MCNMEWGCWHGYFDKKYCHEYDFSGNVSLSDGTFIGLERIIYPADAWGPYTYSKKFEPFQGSSWDSKILNCMQGFRLSAQVDDETEIFINTKAINVRFRVSDLMKQKHLVFPVGPKYSMAYVNIELNDEIWYVEKPPKDAAVIYGSDFDQPDRQADLFTVKGRLVPAGESARAYFTIRDEDDGASKRGVRLGIRFLICRNGQQEEKTARGVARFAIAINGKEIWANRKFSTFHDTASQFLEEVVEIIPEEAIVSGKNTLEVINKDRNLDVLVQRVTVEQFKIEPLAIAAFPQWVIVNNPFSVSISSGCKSVLLSVKYDEELLSHTINGTGRDSLPQDKSVPGLNPVVTDESRVITVGEGEHEFFFTALKPFRNAVIEFRDEWSGASCKVVIAEAWDGVTEEIPVKTGYEIRTGSPYEYLSVLKNAYETQLGNLAIFRDYHNSAYDPSSVWDAAEYCRKHNIYTDAIVMNQQSTVANASGDLCCWVGTHEHTGIFYGRDRVQNKNFSMADAMKESVSILASVADNYRISGVPVAIGDASGGTRTAYMAGFDVIRHETFVGHHTLILTNARGCARAFHKNIWGAHIASQHNAQPELEDSLRRYWLGMYLPWVYGANFAFEEDSLFEENRFYRMIGGDVLPKGKRDITRGFYRFTSTHPRKGKPRVNFAILQGKYAPPFNGISVANNGLDSDDNYVNENYPVWGHTGKEAWEWGFRQPEKGYHLFELLAPNIYLNPLMQDTAAVRKFFSGNPLGEFDQLPVEASADVMKQYKMIALFTWHTMEPAGDDHSDSGFTNDYEKLLEYVRDGGVLFLSVPQLTTRADREMLKDMDDLQLYNGGDVSGLCGVRINGKSSDAFSEAEAERGPFRFAFDSPKSVDLIRRPNSDEDEDGACMLADLSLDGARVVFCDKSSGRPLLTEYKTGKGYTYLLCTYAFPGHEKLKELMPKILLPMFETMKAESRVSVFDESGEIYSSIWENDEKSGTVYLLNTDWTTAGNGKPVTVKKDDLKLDVSVTEGVLNQVLYFDRGMLYCNDPSTYIEVIPAPLPDSYGLTVHTAVDVEISLVVDRDMKIILPDASSRVIRSAGINTVKVAADDHFTQQHLSLLSLTE